MRGGGEQVVKHSCIPDSCSASLHWCPQMSPLLTSAPLGPPPPSLPTVCASCAKVLPNQMSNPKINFVHILATFSQQSWAFTGSCMQSNPSLQVGKSQSIRQGSICLRHITTNIQLNFYKASCHAGTQDDLFMKLVYEYNLVPHETLKIRSRATRCSVLS